MSNELMKLENFVLPTEEAFSEMAVAMSEEMDGLDLAFDRIKIPSGGGMAFEVPGDDPDAPDIEKEIIGVIVDHHPVNAYWEVDYDGQNNPPDCASMDGKLGEGMPGGDCRSCPMNQYGSDVDRATGEVGKGKACKNMHRVYILRDGDLLPVLLPLPPTSLKNLSNYLAKRILTKGLRSYGVITKVALKKAQSAGGITYSQATFSTVGKLDADKTAQMKTYSESIKAATRQLGITNEEYNQAAGGDDAPF